VPIYQTVAYAFDSAQHGADLFDLKVAGNIYTGIMNPTNGCWKHALAALEGGIGALALASGQAAITYAIQTIAEAGDNIVRPARCTAAPTTCLPTRCRSWASAPGLPTAARPGHLRAADRCAHQGGVRGKRWATRWAM
jgi:cystathionine beta-lyase/cystathionine gamma-synthase